MIGRARRGGKREKRRERKENREERRDKSESHVPRGSYFGT